MIPKNRSTPIARSLVLVVALALSGCGILGGGKGGPKTPTVGNRIPILSRIDSGAMRVARCASTRRS